MLHHFSTDIRDVELPTLFTYPFHYTPHPLCRLAAAEVQRYIAQRTEWHDELEGGKMFGVLVVEADGEIGFLAAFSGNLAGRNDHDYFVPAVYDMMHPDDVFKRGERDISDINHRIQSLERSEEYLAAKHDFEQAASESEAMLKAIKLRLAEGKALRNRQRAEGVCDEVALVLASQRENAEAQREKRVAKERVAHATEHLAVLQTEIDRLKHERHERSVELQMWLFSQFRMLNAVGEVRDLCDLFAPTAQKIPPAGAGECAAPKLLQYAYKHGMRPVAMAEFWWGESPKGEVRKHGCYYPACNGKCKPILEHMLIGLDVEPNPLMAIVPAEPRVLMEDDDVVVIDKPCGMLSVRGKSGVRSAEEWAQERYPEAMIVHRLDQSTSGILVIAKHKRAHEALQKQFATCTVRKSYAAIVEGVVPRQSGEIRLPLKLDYENRPRQMVAADGRPAHTLFEVEGYADGRTRMRFYPITGRTHQLRVHSAHVDGLNAPIVGDDIYGTGAERLMLHAESIEFKHPTTGEVVALTSPSEF
ncbi:MAG: RNA pseudouridine synthase [Alistipes sp.]|nr:RNA pseudouridine synthase [Alistipes sp.]